jgi:hypothetical protein
MPRLPPSLKLRRALGLVAPSKPWRRRQAGHDQAGHDSGERDFAFPRQVLPESCKAFTLENKRAQGKPGAQCTRSLVCSEKSTRVSHYGSAETLRPSLRNGLRLMFVLSPVSVTS